MLRRITLSAPTINIEKHMPVYQSQSAFLMNASNKYGFVELLAHHLKENGLTVLQVKDDADTLIVHTALNIDMSDVYMVSEVTQLRSG